VIAPSSVPVRPARLESLTVDALHPWAVAFPRSSAPRSPELSQLNRVVRGRKPGAREGAVRVPFPSRRVGNGPSPRNIISPIIANPVSAALIRPASHGGGRRVGGDPWATVSCWHSRAMFLNRRRRPVKRPRAKRPSPNAHDRQLHRGPLATTCATLRSAYAGRGILAGFFLPRSIRALGRKWVRVPPR